jgi:hypothetical protein
MKQMKGKGIAKALRRWIDEQRIAKKRFGSEGVKI